MEHANDNLRVAAAPATEQELRYLSVCSGIEAATVAWHPLGWRAVAYSEIEKHPSAVLAHHYPSVPNLGDFTKIDTRALGRVDILCGGTPCQAFSVAGARRSLDDARGNLTLAFVELAHELAGLAGTDGNGLRNAVWENVPGVLSTHDNAFGCLLAELVGADATLVPPGGRKWPNAGMVAGPKGRAAWRVLDAQYFGLAQRRKRVIVVADFGNGADPAAVLFEPEGVRRDSPPSRKAGEGVAGTIAGGSRKGGGYSTDDVPLTPVAYAPDIARCVATREGSSQDYESTTMVACVTGDITHSLRAEGADANEDGTGRGTPIVSVLRGISDYGPGLPNLRAKGGDAAGGSEALICVHGTQDPCTSDDTAFTLGRNSGQENVIAFSAKDYGADASVNIAPTLRAGGHTGSHANAGVMPAICFDTTQITSPANRSNPKAGGTGHPLSAQAHPPAVAFTCSEQANSHAWEREVYPTLNSQVPNDTSNIQYGVRIGSSVRRLTPRECERLQGFPDDYTNAPWRGKPTSPDGLRYKELGNSWAVPKFAWLGRRIQMLMPANTNTPVIRDAA